MALRFLTPKVLCMPIEGDDTTLLAKERTMLLRCESLEPPMSQLGRVTGNVVCAFRGSGDYLPARALLQCSLTPWYDPPLLNVQWASRQRPAIYPSKEAGFDSAFAITRRQKLIP